MSDHDAKFVCFHFKVFLGIVKEYLRKRDHDYERAVRMFNCFLKTVIEQLESIKYQKQYAIRVDVNDALQRYLTSCLNGLGFDNYDHIYQIIEKMIVDEERSQTCLWFMFIDHHGTEKRHLDDLFEFIFSDVPVCFLNQFDVKDYACRLNIEFQTSYGFQMIENADDLILSDDEGKQILAIAKIANMGV